MKKLFCGALLLFTTASFASFELVLAPDFAKGVIHRFDGDTGGYFGSFGAGIIANPTAIYANGSTGLCYVTPYRSPVVVAFNYSTGAYVSTFVSGVASSIWSMTPLTATGYVGQVLIGTVTGTHYRGILSPSGFTTLATYTPSSGNAVGATQFSDGRIAVTNNGTGKVDVFNPAGGSPVFTSAAITGFVGGSGSLTGLWSDGANVVASESNGTTSRLVRAAYTGSAINWAGSNAYSATTFVYSYGAAAGHSQRSYFQMGNGAVSDSHLIRFDNILGTTTIIDNAAVGGCWGVATIVAPEPGTIVVLGIAVAVLFARRRRATS